MLRKIIDYSKLNDDLLILLTEKFPNGYSDDDILAFRNAQNEIIEAVEIKTEEVTYLVKVGKKLQQAIEDFQDDEEDSQDEKILDDNNFEDLEKGLSEDLD